MSQSQSWRAWLLYFITILYISHSQEESIEVLSIARLQSDPFPIQLFTRRGIHNDTIHIEIHGPADRWFGIGIGNETMDGTYAFIVSDDGNLTERRLGDHNAGISYI